MLLKTTEYSRMYYKILSITHVLQILLQEEVATSKFHNVSSNKSQCRHLKCLGRSYLHLAKISISSFIVSLAYTIFRT